MVYEVGRVLVVKDDTLVLDPAGSPGLDLGGSIQRNPQVVSMKMHAQEAALAMLV